MDQAKADDENSTEAEIKAAVGQLKTQHKRERELLICHEISCEQSEIELARTEEVKTKQKIFSQRISLTDGWLGHF